MTFCSLKNGDTGLRRTLIQAAATVLIFCGLIGYGAGERQAVSGAAGEDGYDLPVLMYHSLLKDQARQGKYVLSPDVFRADLEYLAQNGYETVVVTDLLDYVENGTPLPDKPVMITFDDGYFNNYLYAYPILKELDMQAVISIIGAQTDLFTENGEENPYWSHLTLDRLREIEGSGVFEIQNHSWNLHTYGERRGCLRKKGEEETAYRTFFTEDTRKTQELLRDAGLKTPTCYTYPFGAYSKEAGEVVRELGFACTLGCSEGINRVTRDADCLYEMKRYNRPSGLSTESMMGKIGI